MKRNSKSQEKLNPENSQNFTRLEVPYAFGTLVITPYLDQESNRLLKVCDEERGYCFGSFSLADNQNLQTELDNVIKCISSKSADPALEILKPLKKKQSAQGRSENACTSRQAETNLTSKRSIDDLEEEQKETSSSKKSRTSQPNISNLKLTSPSETQLVKIQTEMSISQLLWGVLNFFSGKNLIYTHYLWGHDPISINAESLQNVAKLGVGLEQIESLADDFRYILGKGFTLQKKEGMYSNIEFKRSDDEKKACYKILSSSEEIEIKTSNPTLIYEGNKIMSQLNRKVSNLEEGIYFADSLYVIIVINNSFLNKMGITMERINRKNAESMPYYLILKMNTEFDCLNSHIFSKLNIN